MRGACKTARREAKVSRTRTIAIVAAATLGFASASPVHGAPIVFDCDAPSGRMASVSGAIGTSMRATGTLAPVTFQPGRTQPIGGFQVNSSDGLNAIGFQLALTKPDARALDLVLVARNAGKAERRVLRSVPFGTTVPFAMVVPAGGQGSLTLGETVINLSFANLKAGTAVAFCSSGQFRFDNLQILPG